VQADGAAQPDELGVVRVVAEDRQRQIDEEEDAGGQLEPAWGERTRAVGETPEVPPRSRPRPGFEPGHIARGPLYDATYTSAGLSAGGRAGLRRGVQVLRL